MNIGPSYLKRISLINAALILLVAILISLFVIQPAAVDTYPGVKHDGIVFIWGVNISLNILAAYSFVMIAFVKKRIGWMVTTGILMFVVFILAFVFGDAASAYIGHGPEMRSAAITLYICLAIEVIVMFLMLSTFILKKKITLQKSQASLE